MAKRVEVFDLEANHLLRQATKVHCGVFKDIATGIVTKFRPNEIPQMLKHMDECDVLIAHNGVGYDFPLLKKLHNYEFKGKIVDTLVMSRLLNPKRLVPFLCPNKKAGPHGLESWGWRVGRGKPEHNDWEAFSDAMMFRCTEDVEILHLVYKELLQEAKGNDWKAAFLMSFRLFSDLHKQEEYGWLVDKEHMAKSVRILQHWIDRIDKVLVPNLPMILEINEQKKQGVFNYVKKPYLQSGKPSESLSNWYASLPNDFFAGSVGGCFSRISFRVTDLNSNQETKEYLLTEGWEPLEWNINDEGVRTSPKMSKDDPFEGINGKVGKLVAKRVQCRQRKSIIEGLQGIVREDGRISSIVNTLAVTGRATHRGIVNIPKASSFFGKWMRKIFIAGEGKVLVGTDSDSCQLRMLAGRMNSANYIDAIVNGDKSKGTDNHSLTMKIAELDTRDRAKRVIYCLLFGGGDTKLGKTAAKSEGGAWVRERLYKGLDGLEDLVAALTKEWKHTAQSRYNKKFNRMEYFNGHIIGLDGRPIKVPSEHMLLVYLLQSDEAIMMSAAYIKFHKEMEKRGYTYGKEYGTVCFYHDEFTVECDVDIAKEVKEISEQAIAWAGNYYKIPCPHVGDGKIGGNWWEIH